jgi:hypothetical protein
MQARVNLAESQLATGRFAEAEASLHAFLEAPDLKADVEARMGEMETQMRELSQGQVTIGQLSKSVETTRAVQAVVSRDASVVARAIEIAVLVAQGKTQGIPGKLTELRLDVAARPKDFTSGWEFEGTRHFIRQDERLAPWRDWLFQLFDALDAKDRDSMLAGLDTVRSRFTVPRVSHEAPEKAQAGGKP